MDADSRKSYALVAPEPAGRERRCEHMWGDGSLMPWPDVVLMEVGGWGAQLYRYTRDGDFCGDTWHESERDAREAAEWEYEGLLSEWRPLPDAVARGFIDVDARVADRRAILERWPELKSRRS